MDPGDLIDGITIEGGLILPMRVGFGLFIAILFLIVVRVCCISYRDVMDAVDDETPHVSRNQSDVNRSRIRNSEIKKIVDLEANVCVTKV